MPCPQCHTDNKPGRKFCAACGSPLPLLCERCGFPNDPGDRFCGGCGASLVPSSQLPVASPQPPAPSTQPPDPGLRTADPRRWTPPHLADRIRAEQAALEARGATDGERKTITALFADLAGFTALAKDLDPEEARAIIDPALQLMMDAVHRYEGYVAQSLGDGIFALFGAPIAHEDHPQRALYAALLMQEEMRRYAERIRAEKGVPLQIRVGINTGEVVLRSVRKEDLYTDYVPVGPSTNLASRLEGLATPGSIVVSEHTYKLIEGYFDCQALGATQIKGLDTPVHIYEVRGVGPLRTRLQVATKRGLVRFVGRQRELDQLKHALDNTIGGRGQMVGVMGEPGVGKSRLFQEFLRAYCMERHGHLVLQTFSVSHDKASPYLPLIELLKHYFEITPQDDEKKRREKVGGKVLMLDRSLEETLPYLLALLGIADSATSLQQMDPQIRKRRTFDAIKRILMRESLNQPVVVVFEDLHWLDSETQAFLLLLSENIPTTQLLLLVNYRPEYRHDWGSKTYYRQLRLDPLETADAQALLTALLGDSPTLQPLKQFILDKTAGTPFFLEEMVQALFAQQVLGRQGEHVIMLRRLADLRLPTTVQGVLAARIDRLSPEEKNLLQTLSVIGKEFRLSLVQRVTAAQDDTLYRVLNRLQEGEFIYERPAFPEPEYTFKHALTQEVAYNSVLTERRKELHERAAQAIEALFQARLADHYEELAHHYSRSGNLEKAIAYLHKAGQQAIQRSAYTEAINHLTAALDLLKALPDTLERAQQELTLQMALGPTLMNTRGYGALEVEHAYTRALELCQQIGETPQLFLVLRGACLLYELRSELQKTHALARQLLALARRLQDPAVLLQAYTAMGATSFNLGDFASARTHLEQGMALYDSQQHRVQSLLYGQDPGVYGLSYGAYALWFLGYPDQAQKRSYEAIALAQELSRPFDLARALFFAAQLHLFRREGQAAQDRAEGAITIGTEHGFVHRVAVSTMTQGGALTAQGRETEGIAQMCRGLAAYQATGAELARACYQILLAEAYGKVGQTEEGLTLLAEVLARVQKTGERYYEAELWRLKGQLTLQKETRGWRLETSPPSPQASSLKPQVSWEVAQEAERYFLKAIAVAHKQAAKSLELRATVSLARLWQRQGKTTEARQMLAEIYHWFTEGFDTVDLQEAKALLEELTAP